MLFRLYISCLLIDYLGEYIRACGTSQSHGPEVADQVQVPPVEGGQEGGYQDEGQHQEDRSKEVWASPSSLDGGEQGVHRKV